LGPPRPPPLLVCTCYRESGHCRCVSYKKRGKDPRKTKANKLWAFSYYVAMPPVFSLLLNSTVLIACNICLIRTLGFCPCIRWCVPHFPSPSDPRFALLLPHFPSPSYPRFTLLLPHFSSPLDPRFTLLLPHFPSPSPSTL
jgi:hypothetical protein